MAHYIFYEQHPRATKLGLRPVASSGGAEHPGYDIEEVEKALGAEFPKLKAYLADKSVFVCGHRNVEHQIKDDAGNVQTVVGEAHCVYASDLEKFLEQEAAIA